MNEGFEWGGGADLSALEGVMWRADHDPRTRATGAMFERLDQVPDWPGFLAAHEVSGVFGPAGLPQELAQRADKAFTGLPRSAREAAVLTACNAVQVLITVLLRVVGVPQWRGGLLTMAIPPTGDLVGRWAAARGGR